MRRRIAGSVPKEIPRIAVTPAAVTIPIASTTYHSGHFTSRSTRPAATATARTVAVAAIDGISRRMGSLLPGHTSEGHRACDLLDEHLHNRTLRGPRDIDHVLVELRDPVPLLPDILDHELVHLPFDEGRFLD